MALLPLGIQIRAQLSAVLRQIANHGHSPLLLLFEHRYPTHASAPEHHGQIAGTSGVTAHKKFEYLRMIATIGAFLVLVFFRLSQGSANASSQAKARHGPC